MNKIVNEMSTSNPDFTFADISKELLLAVDCFKQRKGFMLTG